LAENEILIYIYAVSNTADKIQQVAVHRNYENYFFDLFIPCPAAFGIKNVQRKIFSS
jgi:hypothetical protein